MSAGLFSRLRQLSSERRRLLWRATILLSVTSALVALLPFRIAIRFGCVPLGVKAQYSVDDVLWAVETAARRLPWRIVCIEKGLVTQRMLRSVGFDAILRYGARHHPDSRKLEAHVWVTVDSRAVMGGQEAPAFALVATYP
jgi:hypothetical protein